MISHFACHWTGTRNETTKTIICFTHEHKNSRIPNLLRRHWTYDTILRITWGKKNCGLLSIFKINFRIKLCDFSQSFKWHKIYKGQYKMNFFDLCPIMPRALHFSLHQWHLVIIFFWSAAKHLKKKVDPRSICAHFWSFLRPANKSLKEKKNSTKIFDPLRISEK